jgi:hypothetical protein
MSAFETLGLIAALLALLPAALTLVNLVLYRPPRAQRVPLARVSVLVPARNEERSIGDCVRAALANRDVELEVVVMDDHSSDRTAAVVRDLARSDRRVRLESAPPLPPDWCGKQHACAELARAARHPYLVFVDADVRLSPTALCSMVGFLEESGADLASGIPGQETGSFLERLVIPLIHFVMLGFLPMPGMRASRKPLYAAGCGQLFITRRDAYRRSGGHGAIRASRHDGITLPRAFREAGLRTDLFDATRLASCRMYRGAVDLWRGFAKNADEGMATAAGIVPWTVLLVGGQVLPPLLLVRGWIVGAPLGALGYAILGTVLVYGTRFLLALRFRQSWLGALLHPLGAAVVVAIQWFALLNGLRGRSVPWKGRAAC